MHPLFLVTICAYVLGSIPTAYWLVKWRKGVDIRTVGSGNSGATNAGRVLGRAGGILVFAIDILKGWVAVAWVPGLILQTVPAGSDTLLDMAMLLGGLAVLCGHIWSCFLRFSGGKGVATGLGAFLGIAPGACGIAALIWAATLLVTRTVSIASIAAVCSVPLLMLLTTQPSLAVAMSALAAMLIVGKHWSNIRRLVHHEEPTVW